MSRGTTRNPFLDSANVGPRRIAHMTDHDNSTMLALIDPLSERRFDFLILAQRTLVVGFRHLARSDDLGKTIQELGNITRCA